MVTLASLHRNGNVRPRVLRARQGTRLGKLYLGGMGGALDARKGLPAPPDRRSVWVGHHIAYLC
jgi:hypothetical protein